MANKADDIQQEIKKARQNIADTRSAITDKLAVLEDRVQETVDGVKHTFDLHYQVKQRPWLMLGGSVLMGCALARRGTAPCRTAETSREPSTRVQPQQSIASDVRNKGQDDIAAIKGAVFGAVMSTLWAMAKQVLLEPARKIDGVVITPTAQPSDSRHFTQRVIISKTNGRHEP